MKQKSITRLVTLLSLAVLLYVFATAQTQAATFTVDRDLDGSDATPGDGLCATAAGNCTLRAAIEEANAFSGTDTIAFNISGVGVRTITPASAYPTVSQAVIIDGWTQGGVGYTGPPLIELNGANTTSSDGLILAGGNSTVRGLIINRFESDGIELTGSGGNTIQGCYIGTDATGSTDSGNGNGIRITSPNNTIGGILAARRNVISGNNTGIAVSGSQTSGNRVQGNYIGTNAGGSAELGNSYGVYLTDDAVGVTIGGTTPAERNIISGCLLDGVRVQGASNSVISGNYIGTEASGTLGLGNNGNGVNIFGGSTNITIGGTTTGERNVISANGNSGINISGSTIRFDVVNNAAAGETAVTLGDSPVVREVADVNANALPATFQNGAVTILFPTASSVSLGGYVLTQQGRAPRGASVTLTDLLGNSRETTVNRFGYYHFTEVEAGRTYLLTVTAKGYNFTPPTAVVTPNFDIAELNFTAFPVRRE